MDSSTRLSVLQIDLLHAFFAKTDRFFLTGGAALAGFYLHDTRDLDLFATAEVDPREGVGALQAAAAAIGATARLLRESGDFRQFQVNRGKESTVVDLVIDRAPQVVGEKPVMAGIRIDPLREIAANKVCALLGRMEPRDLVDLKLLLATGIRLEDALVDAQIKDASADAATLGWVLSELRIGKDAAMPGGVSGDELEAFRLALVQQLRTAAFPTP